MQACEHKLHLYGFSPVCERRWTIKLLWKRKHFPQNSHAFVFPFPAFPALLLPAGLSAADPTAPLLLSPLPAEEEESLLLLLLLRWGEVDRRWWLGDEEETAFPLFLLSLLSLAPSALLPP